MKISTLLFITGLVPAAVVAGPAPKPNPEPEPALQAPKPVPPVDKPIKCILQGDVDSKKVPAQCGPSAGKFKKGTTVFFTCNIATDTIWLKVGSGLFSTGPFIARNQDAVLPCIGSNLPKC